MDSFGPACGIKLFNGFFLLFHNLTNVECHGSYLSYDVEYDSRDLVIIIGEEALLTFK
jgi:hypothetical protein